MDFYGVLIRPTGIKLSEFEWIFTAEQQQRQQDTQVATVMRRGRRQFSVWNSLFFLHAHTLVMDVAEKC